MRDTVNTLVERFSAIPTHTRRGATSILSGIVSVCFGIFVTWRELRERAESPRSLPRLYVRFERLRFVQVAANLLGGVVAIAGGLRMLGAGPVSHERNARAIKAIAAALREGQLVAPERLDAALAPLRG